MQPRYNLPKPGPAPARPRPPRAEVILQFRGFIDEERAAAKALGFDLAGRALERARRPPTFRERFVRALGLALAIALGCLVAETLWLKSRPSRPQVQTHARGNHGHDSAR